MVVCHRKNIIRAYLEIEADGFDNGWSAAADNAVYCYTPTVDVMMSGVADFSEDACWQPLDVTR
jgi:hypothetical protein